MFFLKSLTPECACVLTVTVRDQNVMKSKTKTKLLKRSESYSRIRRPPDLIRPPASSYKQCNQPGESPPGFIKRRATPRPTYAAAPESPSPRPLGVPMGCRREISMVVIFFPSKAPIVRRVPIEGLTLQAHSAAIVS